MIPAASITAWAQRVPWQSARQVEQDLLLRRVIIEIARHPLLDAELVFWGGTALHALHLPVPRRYSEDLDYRRRTDGPIGPLLDAIRGVAASVGFLDVRTNVGAHPKVLLRADAEDGSGPIRVKVEMNTLERGTTDRAERRPLALDTDWFSGGAEVCTLPSLEIVATKIRALFQREKGRDLYDLWLGLTEIGIDPVQLADVFERSYRPASFSVPRLRELLADRLSRRSLHDDVRALLATDAPPYDPETAWSLVVRDVLPRLS